MALRRDFNHDWGAAGNRPGLRVEVLKRWLTEIEKRGLNVQVQRRLLEDDHGGWRVERFDQEDLVAEWIDQTLAQFGRPSVDGGV